MEIFWIVAICALVAWFFVGTEPSKDGHAAPPQDTAPQADTVTEVVREAAREAVPEATTPTHGDSVPESVIADDPQSGQWMRTDAELYSMMYPDGSRRENVDEEREVFTMLGRYNSLSGRDKYRVCEYMHRFGFARKEDFAVLGAKEPTRNDPVYTFNV